MNLESFEKYNSQLPYSYAFGAFVTIELLKNRPQDVLCVFIDKKFQNQEVLNSILSFCKNEKIPVKWDQKTINKIRAKENCLIIGVFLKKIYPVDGKRQVLLKNIQDEGTLGTIIRSIRGFEFNQLVLIHPQVDLFHPQVIRASMGSFFSVSISIYHSLNAYKQDFNNQPIYFCHKNGLLSLNQMEKDLTPLSLYFNENSFNENKNSIQINDQCSLENNINIVLFHFYSS